MAAQSLRIGLVQSRVGPDARENVARTVEFVREAAGRGARLVCLQELFASPYFCQTEDPEAFAWAEALDGASVTALSEVARQLGITVLVPIFERRAPGLFHNSAVMVGPDGQRLGVYRKMHIPDDPQFMEKYYFTPGDLGFRAMNTPVGKVGTLICWDQWYPEAARLTALQGAQLLLYPTAIGWLPSEKAAEGAAQLDAWKTMQRAHAIANGLFVVAVNRVGQEGDPNTGIEFWGHSFVADPLGRVLVEAGEGEEVLTCDLDLSMLEETRKWWPFFRDRRIDAYGDITRRWTEDS
ncbi:MAG TPA: carbon-nitrogen hydrolase [Polyangiaceae bacterium]|nr:carbon-nitrogen hydrolase [Polyangiaceae bacterium]